MNPQAQQQVQQAVIVSLGLVSGIGLAASLLSLALGIWAIVQSALSNHEAKRVNKATEAFLNEMKLNLVEIKAQVTRATEFSEKQMGAWNDVARSTVYATMGQSAGSASLGGDGGSDAPKSVITGAVVEGASGGTGEVR